MKTYRIEKALVLGLLLSTSVYGVAMAEDIVETNKQYSEENIEADNIYLKYDENFKVNCKLNLNNHNQETHSLA